MMQGRIFETTEFPGTSNLEYGILLTPDAQLSATFDVGEIHVGLPRAMAERWFTTDDVGIEATHGSLKILIEKDFECSNPDESQADAFPNPNKCS